MDDQLTAVLADAIARLGAAARDRHTAMHTPAVGTTDADVRVMVLRAFEEASSTMRFHLDARSPKRAVIEADPRIGVLFYDKAAGLQLRCRGQGRVERDGAVADAAWLASDPYARRCYLGAAPGEESDSPTSGLPDWIAGKRPTEEQLVAARINFAILLVEVEEIDWFSLAHNGHRRAIFRGSDDWRGQWIAP